MFFCPIVLQAQSSPFLDSLLKASMPTYSNVLTQPNKYKATVYYTMINRDENNKPTFKNYKFHSNKNYFYPASTVKLPIGITAMVKLEELNKPGLNKETAMITDSGYFCQRKINWDTTSASDRPNIGNYIKKMYLISDNASCARVYEFVGCDYLHNKLESFGYKNVRITNRLDGACPGDTAKVTPPIYFLNSKNDTIYKQPLTPFTYVKPHPIPKSEAGKGHMEGGKKVWKPKDFSKHNYIPLNDLHDMMKRLVFNNYLQKKDKLPLSDSSRMFLIKELGMYPRESDYPKYDPKTFYDSYKKYCLYACAVASIGADSIRVFNIVGRAYGFLIDCAYIVDFKNKTEFLVTVSIYTNEKNVVGSGRYEYDLIGLPFIQEVSKCLNNYELKRKKEHLPNLDEFNLFGYPFK